MIFCATGDRMGFATRSEGGCGKIPAQGVATPHSFILLILLWLSPVNRPPRAEREKKRRTRATPPKSGGACDPDSGTEWHTAIRPHVGSLSSSFMPAGRLGISPPEGR